MSKEALLKLLRDRQGSYISGNELGTALGISRAAVWKMVKALREQGYRIESRTNRGYFLVEESHQIVEEEIMHSLHTKWLGRPLRLLESVESTNTLVRQQAEQGLPEGYTLVALKQTGGRGRQGRSFLSPRGGIYMSVLLRPKIRIQDLTLITFAGAVSVAKAVEECTGIPVEIKWVNDLLIGDRKLCGILTEASVEAETGEIRSVIVGIGLNAEQAPDLTDGKKSISLGQMVSFRINKSGLIADILGYLEENLETIQSSRREVLLNSYRSRLTLLGKGISVCDRGESFPCRAVDLDETGGLVVEFPNGEHRILRPGEASIQVS